MAFKFKVIFRGEDLGVLSSDDITMDEGQQLEDKTKMTINEMIVGINKSSAMAYRAVVWFQLMRTGKHVELFQPFKYGDVEFDTVPADSDPTEAVSETAGTSTSPS